MKVSLFALCILMLTVSAQTSLAAITEQQDEIHPLVDQKGKRIFRAIDIIKLIGGSLLGIMINILANLNFNYCLQDFSRFIELVYASYYFVDFFHDCQDGHQLVYGIVYAIEGWQKGLNMRCYEFSHRIISYPFVPPQQQQLTSSTEAPMVAKHAPVLIFDSLMSDFTNITDAFAYCEIIIDYITANYLMRHLDYRDSMTWINAGFFAGKGATNAVFVAIKYTQRIIKIAQVDYSEPKDAAAGTQTTV